MRVTQTAISDVLILEPEVFEDERGFFFESFSRERFASQAGILADFVQDNHSHSRRGVLRGLHYQLAPMAQGKLVRVVRGEVFDVAVDLRPSSVTFGRWTSAVLSESNRRQLWIPEGFAHGFVVTSDAADVLYKTTRAYSPAHERCIAWNDPDLEISWPECAPLLSPKDRGGGRLREAPAVGTPETGS